MTRYMNLALLVSSYRYHFIDLLNNILCNYTQIIIFLLQNEVELIERTSRFQPITAHGHGDIKINETTCSSHHDQMQHQNQMDLLRRQIQSLMEKEKSYKYEITDLKQHLSRRYVYTIYIYING